MAKVKNKFLCELLSFKMIWRIEEMREECEYVALMIVICDCFVMAVNCI